MLVEARRRSRWVVLVLVALVSSLLAVSADPTAGQDEDADDLPNYSACVGPATDSAGFGDIDRHSEDAEAAINCLAYYRITTGTSSGAFEPLGEVTRWQMALFLIRAAGPAGIVVPRASDQDFTDIGGMAPDTRDAINQLADLGITKGTSTGTFSPYSVVSRRQMAQFLARFLDAALVGPGGVDIEDVDPDDSPFRDIGRLPRGAYEPIVTLFEMGVTTGTTETRFSPDAPVTRAQMALFITRALAHTNARPAGITVQTGATTVTAEEASELVISVRSKHHRPIADAPVDLFYATSRREAFEDDGECSDDVEAELGGRPCVIDLSDETTDRDGNLAYDLIVFEDIVLWVWTGDQRDRFDLDEVETVSVEFNTVKPATDLLLTDDLHPEALKAPYGRSVTFAFQLVDEDEAPVIEEGVEIQLRTEEVRDGRTIRRRTRTYYTDSSGAVELNYRIGDPDLDDDDVETDLYLKVLDSSELDLIDKSAVGVLGEDDQGDDIPLTWSDEDEEAMTLLLDLSVAYHLAHDTGRGGRNRVTATLLDQYGDPVRGERIHFISDDLRGLDEDPEISQPPKQLAKPVYRKPTNRQGVATVSYYRDSDDPGIEIIEAFTEEDDAADVVHARAVKHFWVDEAPERRLYYYALVHLDGDRNTMVIQLGGNGPYLVTFDSNDQFNVDNNTEKFDSFRKNLVKSYQQGLEDEVTVDVTVEVQSHDRDEVNSFTRYE